MNHIDSPPSEDSGTDDACNTDSDTVALCRALVRRPSLTPDDAGCQDIISARLQALGFSIERMRFGQVDNLWARLGEKAPLTVFAGHTDVVPVGDEQDWSHPPFSAASGDGRVIGRGTADMKGSLAAMITAIERFVTANPSPGGSIGVLITSDEEGPATDGTARVVDTLNSRGVAIDHCIVGEPSSAQVLGDTLRHGRRGSLHGRLLITGIQGHVAYPSLAVNPIHQAAPLLSALTAIAWDQGTEDFPPTTLQISNIHAGTGAGNVIPGSCVVDFNLRFSPALTADEIEARVQALLDEHEARASVEWRLSAEPFITAKGSLTDTVSAAILDLTGVSPQLDTGGGTSDGRFLIAISRELVEFGPINATIHQVNEHVDCNDLDSLSSIYESVLDRLIGTQTGVDHGNA